MARNVVLLYQEEKSEKNFDNEQEVWEVLFRRVNSGGTVLQREEMAYSLLKVRWYEVYDLVNEIVQDEGDSYNSFRQRFWNNSKVVLLWHQRAYMGAWFKGHNPASNDAYDTPYNRDHIMPNSLLIFSGGSPEYFIENLSNKEVKIARKHFIR